QATAVVTIGDEQFVVTELAAEDPLSWTAWRAVPMDEFDGQYHDHFLTEENGDFDHHRITVGEEGAAFVLVGPPVRILLETEEETGASEDGDQQVDEERVNREHKEQARV
ncbi:MAG: hypothetical protein JXC32_20990, partial [Anaerolineae bacterium]|nr:hypothetical protein [Anaerolineae bacterium]